MRARSTALAAVAMTLMVAGCGDGAASSEANDGLVAFYQLDGDAVDAARTNDGTVVGGMAVADRAGRETGAMRFGEGDYIEIPHNDAFSVASDFTIAAWVKPAAGAPAGTFQTIFEKSDPERGGHSRYGLWIRDGQIWACFEAADNSRQPCAETEDILTSDQWQHVAAVRSQRRLVIFLDGVEAANAFVGLYEVSATSFSAFIGTDRYQEPAEWLHATLDEVRVYDRALSPEEIAALARP